MTQPSPPSRDEAGDFGPALDQAVIAERLGRAFATTFEHPDQVLDDFPGGFLRHPGQELGWVQTARPIERTVEGEEAWRLAEPKDSVKMILG